MVELEMDLGHHSVMREWTRNFYVRLRRIVKNTPQNLGPLALVLRGCDVDMLGQEAHVLCAACAVADDAGCA